MKTKVVKIILIFVLFFLITNINISEVYASEASVSATNCNVGESFTVTVNIPQDAISYEGTITVTYSDGTSESSKILGLGQNLNDIMSDYYWPGNASKTFTGKIAGNATVSVSGLILNNASGAKINSNSTLTTAITITDPTPAVQPETPSDNNSSSGNTTPEPEPKPNLTFKDVNETMYTTRRVNIRQGYGTDSLIIQTLPVDAELTRTGISSGTANGYSWSRVSYNGITGYVITGALTNVAPEKTEEPEEEIPEETDEEVPEEEENTDELTEAEKELIVQLQDELGTIPEVGVNIMPFLFMGCIVSCLVMIYEVKLKKRS